MDIVELLELRGLDTSKKVKLVRHQDSRYDVYELMTNGQLEIYQACQSRAVLECDYMVSFIGLSRSTARLYGVYRVLERSHIADVSLPDDFPIPEPPENFFYKLERDTRFHDLEERVVIDWGASTRAWHQWLSQKEVMEVLPSGYARPFPGYLDFTLSHYELNRIIQHPAANREWQIALSNVAGIYLILHQSTGAQYIGSASGSAGIYGRWQDYVKNGHGGNKWLKKIIDDTPDAYRNFKYSILRTLPKSMSSKEVIEYENFYKEKLGSRAFGLNEN